MAEDVLLITVDALRADRLTQFGYSRDTSPRLSEAFDEGIVYRSAVAGGPTTFTSFPSIFTGSHAYENPEFPEVSSDTVARSFQAAGYDTLSITSNVWTSPTYGYDAGFDEVDHLGQGPRGADSRWDRLRHRIGDLLGDGVLFTAAKTAYDTVRSVDPDPQTEEDTIHDTVTSHVDRDGRTFTWAHFMTTHAPYTVDPEGETPFVDDVPTLEEQRALIERARDEPEAIPEPDRDLLSDLYDASIRHVDRRIGDLLDAVDLEDTLVCLTADHGETFWDHGNFEHPPSLHEELLHVPLVVLSPAHDPREVQTPVGLSSLSATLRALAGIEDPSPAVLPPWGEHDEYICSAVAHGSRFEPEKASRDDLQIAVRHGEWKLLRRPDHPDALYDLAADPSEATDRADERPDLAATMGDVADSFGSSLSFGEPSEVPTELEDQLSDLGYLE